MTSMIRSVTALPSLEQRSFHDSLFSPRQRPKRWARRTSGQMDAIVVPASRSAGHLDGAVRLSLRTGVPLVLLCSQRTTAKEASLVVRRAGASALILDVDASHARGHLPVRTSAERFRRVAAGRNSDLGRKRNIGLLLARLRGWGKVLFLDDDIGSMDGIEHTIPLATLTRIARSLDFHQIAGMSCEQYPDNSVVCHARKLAGLPQGNFVSGAVLGVNCGDQPLPFFPDIYNEDWFFFSQRAAAREIAHVGVAVQERYDPYETPARAQQEEFGDLLAEGMYALFEEQPAEMTYARRLAHADAEYWERFMLARLKNLRLTRHSIAAAVADGADSRAAEKARAIRSLDAAEEQLLQLGPDLCVDFLDAWIADLREWEAATQRMRPVGSLAEACAVLGLDPAHSVGLPETPGLRGGFSSSGSR